MSAVTDRYERHADLYARHWAPVLAPAAARLLDRVDPWVRATLRERQRLHILDIGTGTGTLAIDAATRWPEASITAIDASSAMLEVARGRAGSSSHISFHRADADHLQVGDASIDLVISSFVFQLVPDRSAALREALRVLRPRGRLVFVSWLVGREEFRPADEFDEAVYDVDIEEEEPEEEIRAGDFTSVRAAERELRKAGFRFVRAELDQLDHRWDPEAYFEYKVAYDETDLFDELGEDLGDRLRTRVRERFAALGPEDFRWQAPIVQARGDRPG